MATLNITGNVGRLTLPGGSGGPSTNTVNMSGVTDAFLTAPMLTTDTINLADHSVWIGGLDAVGQPSAVTIRGEKAIWDNNTTSHIRTGTIDVAAITGKGEIVHESTRKNPGTLTFMHGTAVGAGQTVAIGGDYFLGGLADSRRGAVEVQSPSLFHASVKLGFGELEIDGLHGTSYSLKHDLLSIFNGNRVVDTIHLIAAAPTDRLGPQLAFGVSQTAAGISIHADGMFYSAGGTALPLHG